MSLAECLRPIGRKLPLLVSALLVLVIAAFSWYASRELEDALLGAAGEKVVGVSQRLSGLFDESASRLRSDARLTAADPVVVRVLTAPDSASRAAARRLLASKRSASPQIASIAILNGRREAVVTAGDPGIPADAVGALASGAANSVVRQVAFGPLEVVGDTVRYAVVAPILRGADTLGFLVQRRLLADGGSSARVIGQLIGPQALFLLGNTDTRAWSDMSGPVSGPAPPLVMGSAVRYGDDHRGTVIGAAARVPRAPWAVWVELPLSSVLAPARTFVLRTGAIALVLVVLGTVAAWLVIHRVTAPLAAVTRAAEGIASGDYSRRVEVTGSDELSRLGESFNIMAQRVAESTHQLEERVETRTRELRQALEALHGAHDELVRRERLAILGQLAGGVGHELRNPLGVMTNALYYLGVVLHDAPPDVKEYLGILRTQVGLSEKIVGDLLDYARVKSPKREAVELRDLVSHQLARVGPPDGVRVDIDLPADLPAVHADRTQVGQVLLNLLSNAVQAMDGHGAERGAEGTLTLRGRVASGMVRLDVIDSGSGIAPGDMERIFEPLFTTKARGIGLGLAVSRALVRANGGDIAVSSRPGEGATFTVTLPRVERGGGAA